MEAMMVKAEARATTVRRFAATPPPDVKSN
jgi:hypothetical protein